MTRKGRALAKALDRGNDRVGYADTWEKSFRKRDEHMQRYQGENMFVVFGEQCSLLESSEKGIDC